MHGDNYMWIEKCSHSNVIVLETQSCLFVFIQSKSKYDKSFHIRELYSKYRWHNSELKGLTLKKLRQADFKPTTQDMKSLYYGDNRDEGYICSTDWEGNIKDAEKKTLSVIESMKYWEIYLDDPSQLE